MKRVTVLFDDERLYRQIKMEAAREGRPVKDVVAEALGDWLRRRADSTAERKRRLKIAVRLSDQLLADQPERETIVETLASLREERSRVGR